MQVGLNVLKYHKKMLPGVREDALQQLREREGWVLVCTDAAARGIDFGGVRHIIQADFPSNSLDFLHRIGRTGRAGRCEPVCLLSMPHSPVGSVPATSIPSHCVIDWSSLIPYDFSIWSAMAGIGCL
jgi:superfamily II DNA/RNA helicase